MWAVPLVAIQRRAVMGAVFVFKLEARMGYAKVFAQAVLDLALNRLEARSCLRLKDDVVVERCLLLLNLPQMNVMHVVQTIHAAHGLEDIGTVEIGWATKHQRPDRTSDLGQRQLNDVERGADCNCRIDPA